MKNDRSDTTLDQASQAAISLPAIYDYGIGRPPGIEPLYPGQQPMNEQGGSQTTVDGILAYQAEQTKRRMRVHDPEPKISKYVIINDIDKPEFAMICQWVPGVGYCYLDRRGTKRDHDGMSGREATAVEAFGISWAENRDGTVSFYLTDRPSEAIYLDGEPRHWQERPGVDAYDFSQLTKGAVQK